MLRDEQLRCVGPLGSMFPPERQRQSTNALFEPLGYSERFSGAVTNGIPDPDYGRGAGGTRKENGHKQMLGQAAAMLVSFPARLAAELGAIEFPPLFRQGLAITRPTNASLLETLVYIRRVPLIINRTILHLDLAVGPHEFVCR